MGTMSESELKDTAQKNLAGAPPCGSVWVHYKGGFYSIVRCSIEEATLQPMVTYHSNARNTDWTRPLEVFLGSVTVDGVKRPRFERHPG